MPSGKDYATVLQPILRRGRSCAHAAEAAAEAVRAERKEKKKKEEKEGEARPPLSLSLCLLPRKALTTQSPDSFAVIKIPRRNDAGPQISKQMRKRDSWVRPGYQHRSTSAPLLRHFGPASCPTTLS